MLLLGPIAASSIILWLTVLLTVNNDNVEAFPYIDAGRVTVTARGSENAATRTTKITAIAPRPTTTALYMENLFSSITNIAPSKPLLDSNKSLGKTLFSGTFLETKWDQNLVSCAYKASKDGWSAIKFHECVDNKGSALIVALSRNSPGLLFGAYNPSGWRSTDDYFNSNAAFLWYSKGGSNAAKCPVSPGGNAAIFDYAAGGPCFGSSDLRIGLPKAAVMGGFAGPDLEDTALNAGSLRVAQSNFGGAYEKDNGWPIRGNNIQLVEVEAYCVL